MRYSCILPKLCTVSNALLRPSRGSVTISSGSRRRFLKNAIGMSTVTIVTATGVVLLYRQYGDHNYPAIDRLFETTSQITYEAGAWTRDRCVSFLEALKQNLTNTDFYKDIKRKYLPERKPIVSESEKLSQQMGITKSETHESPSNSDFGIEQNTKPVVTSENNVVTFEMAQQAINKCIQNYGLLYDYLISIVKTISLDNREEALISQQKLSPPQCFVDAIHKCNVLMNSKELSNEDFDRLKQSIMKLMALIDVEAIVKQFRTNIDNSRLELRNELGILNSMTGDPHLIDQLLIAHAHAKIKELQSKLNATLCVSDLRFEKEMKIRIDDRLAEIRKTLTRELESKRNKESQKLIDSELRKYGTLLEASHEQALTRHKMDIEKKLKADMQKALLDVSIKNHQDMADKESQLNLLQHLLKEQQLAEHKSKQAQQVWIESNRLSDNALRHCDRLSVLRSLHKIKSLPGRLSLTDQMMDVLADNVVSGGPLCSADDLIRRFEYVRLIADSVIGVDDLHCNLLAYVKAYLNSMWRTISGRRRIVHLSPDGLINPSDMSSEDALAIASGFVASGNLLSAVKILGLLNGEPKHAVASWLQDTIRYLAVKQCCELIVSLSTCGCLNSSPDFFSVQT